MKLNLKKLKKAKPMPAVKGERRAGISKGPIPSVGGARFNFFPGDSLDRLDELNALLRKVKSRTVTKAFVLRQASKAWITAKIIETKKALKGSFHAKPRN